MSPSSSEQGNDLVIRATGTVIDLDADSRALAFYLLDIRELQSELREATKAISREILNRQDRMASWTMRLDGVKVTGQSPQPSEEWDGAELHEALMALVDRDLLSVEAVDAAVETVVTYKPRKAGITALRRLGGEVAATVNRLCRSEEKERRVSVSRVV
jgi:hypothetical protein